MKLSDFLEENATRDRHNRGSKLWLNKEQYLVVVGKDSDIGRRVAADRYRLAGQTAEEIAPKLRNLFAELVIDWSFDEKITVDLVDELFLAYPKVYDLVIEFYSDYGNFLEG